MRYSTSLNKHPHRIMIIPRPRAHRGYSTKTQCNYKGPHMQAGYIPRVNKGSHMQDILPRAMQEPAQDHVIIESRAHTGYI